MNMQQVVALTTGLAYLTAGFITVPAIKLLGKSYRNHATVHWGGILVGVIYAVVLFFRGSTILYPGEVVSIGTMSWIAPTVPLTLCLVNFYVLDFIQRHRDPPPLFERFIRTFLKRSPDDDRAAELAFALPPAAVGDTPMDETPPEPAGQITRHQRVAVLIAAVLGLAGVVALIVASSPVTAAIAS